MGKTLNEIGVLCHTDKSSLLHSYLNEYEKLFKEPDAVLNICEIGLQRGGKWNIKGKELPSVNMWLEFFPNANIYGFDLKDLDYTNPRVKIIQGDQGKKEDLQRLYDLLPDEVDFIIDDGSHQANHQLKTFKKLFPKLKEGGVYIIEDCNPVVQSELPKSKKIHSLMDKYLKEKKHVWIASKSAGEKSSLAIIK